MFSSDADLSLCKAWICGHIYTNVFSSVIYPSVPLRLVRFDPLGHNLLTAIVNPSNQQVSTICCISVLIHLMIQPSELFAFFQNEDDSEVPMDSVEMPHFRQRSFLPSQPVRRTPILHNFLHILSSRSPGSQSGGEQQSLRPLGENGTNVRESPSLPLAQYPSSERGPLFPGCTQHLGMVCPCSRCSVNRNPPPAANTNMSDAPQPPPASTFSSARTEPRQPSERPSAFTTVYYNSSLNPAAATSIESHSAPRLGPDWPRNLQSMREGGVGPGLLPPRTSSSSISLLSVLRHQDSTSQPPVYTSASEGRGFPQQGESGARDGAGMSSGHHPFWDGSRSNSASFRNVLQCNLSRYFMEFDRMQDLEPPLGGSMTDGGQEQTQELLNNNMDPERPGPSSSASPTIIHYQPPLPPAPTPHSLENNVPPPGSQGHLNRCRACHNLLTYNHDSQRWERTNQASATSASTLEPSYSSSSSSLWQPEEGRRTLENQPQERRAASEPSEQPPPPGGGGAATLAFPITSTPSQPGEQTVGLVYNQDTAQWERVYRQATTGRSVDPPEALSQEMPVDPPDEDSLRRYDLFVSSFLLSAAHMS